jgi:hypothetical protein
MEIQILDVAFVIAVTAFFKKQFGWEQKIALIAAFVVALVVGIAPQVSAALPLVAPWIDSTLRVVVIFLSAAGSYDFAVGLMQKNEDIKELGSY